MGDASRKQGAIYLYLTCVVATAVSCCYLGHEKLYHLEHFDLSFSENVLCLLQNQPHIPASLHSMTSICNFSLNLMPTTFRVKFLPVSRIAKD